MKDLSLKSKSILLISPSFFGYELAIKEKLTQMGAHVTLFDDRPSNSLVSKGLIRIHKKLMEIDTLKYYSKIICLIENQKFDIIFLLNPEALPISFLEMCKVKWSQALYVMYMWDAIRNRKHTLDYVPLCDRVFTFDMDDAITHHLLFKPLFYLDIYSSIRQNNHHLKYDVCFLGTLHSDRYAIAKQVKDWCTHHKLSCFFYFFMQSRVLHYFNQFKTKGVMAPMSEVSFEKLTASQILEIVTASKVILDIHHPKQTGLTMRTLETIGAGKKLITTNHKIREYNFYREENITVIDRNNPIRELDLSFFLSSPKEITEQILMNYSIGSWLTDLLGE